ncbi:NF038132 family protein [Pseudoduganella sp. OTU4001]|uniref:NF038132 family protein n=1 Tax=Pseudoduganella sp. OTU4001 TaxID=3043854 RepID=UPI00313D04F1
MQTRNFIRCAAVALSALGAVPASAGTSDGGIPEFWTCSGSCGASGADGVVPLAPGGGSAYGWISTWGSTAQAALPGVGTGGADVNGTILRSVSFDAAAGAQLDFRFNFVSTDGDGYADYAWARLLDQDNNQVAMLFTARTTEAGNAIPGFGLPATQATLTPFPVPIMDGETKWAPLGPDSDECYDVGCGATGWVRAQYAIASNGTYRLEFGVTNWDDQDFDSGLALDAITVGGAPLPIPEPGQYAMLLAGLAVLGVMRPVRGAGRGRCRIGRRT